MHRSNGPQIVVKSSGVSVGLKRPLDTLHSQFVNSMKTLFDILDDQRTGFVRLSDIEKGWQDDGCKGLPQGVVENLRKVTPPSGLLSFERFCAGLKICLSRNQTDPKGRHSSADNGNENLTKPQRPPSAPILDIENPLPNSQWTSNNTAAVRPNNAMQAQRTLSLPQLSPDSDLDISSDPVIPDIFSPPPKPPRSAIISPNNVLDKAEIRHALQNWQMGILMNEMDAKDQRKNFVMKRLPRGTGDGGSNDSARNQSNVQSPDVMYQKKANVKRREPRRHTLQNGIDYNMLKRLKQFEEEKDVLLEGLTAVEKAREWYHTQISNIQDKMKYLGRMGSHIEQWSESHQERLDFQRARVLEINRHLSALADCWERGGFPLHMNLAVRVAPSATSLQAPENVNRLKQKNRVLTEEVNQKTEKISILEHEKQSLLRELVQIQRSREVAVVNSSSTSSALVDADVVF